MKNTVTKINFEVIAAGRAEENKTEYWTAKSALRDYVAEAVPAVEQIINADVVAGCRVRETVGHLVQELGRVDAFAVVAALVTRYANDGRIYPESVAWARRVPYESELTFGGCEIYSNKIHKAHLQQVAQAMREWEQEHPADAEPVEAEPVQAVEAEAVEAAPVADPAPVAAEAAPAEAEPVKVARKARKPRKAAPVADTAAVADPAAVEAAARIKARNARRGEPQPKIPDGCTATVIDGVVVAVSSCGDLTSSPAPVADAEPVKPARKARKPRKAAPVAAEPVEAVPVAEPVTVAAEPVEMVPVDAQTVQVVEAEPVRSVAAAAAVAPASEVLSVPADAEPAAVGGWNFGASSVEVSGRVLPVSYSVTRSDEVYAFTALDGVAVRLHIGKGDALYAAALAAARGEAEARKAARMEPVKMAPVGAQAAPVDAEPVEAEAVAVEPIEAAPAADPVPVAAEAAPAEAEPVKAGRKARKPRKAAPVAAEPVSVGADPIEAVTVAAEAEAVAVDPIEAVTAGAEPIEAVAVDPIEAVTAGAEPVQVVEAEAVAVDAEPVEMAAVAAQAVSVGADPAPVAVDPVPAAVVEGCAQGKSWAGSSIVGDGWRIVFDAVEERTRVICAAPTDAQKAAIEGAGFWWSPRMGSWNKKLTCKAYRAAVALAEELRRIA